MNTYEQLFESSKTQENTRQIMIRELHAFEGHPFRVTEDEDMEELVQSIRDQGILVPVMVRARVEGGYEIISGHRRCHAAKRAGLFKVPAVVCHMSDEEAVNAMVYANVQRSSIRPSERARAYRMQIEAMRHPGVRGEASSIEVGRKFGDNARKVQRYIRLTFLIPDLLALVDEGKLSLQSGYLLSFIRQKEQRWVMELYKETKKLPSGLQAERIRRSSDDQILTEKTLREIIGGRQQQGNHLVLKRNKIESFFPPETEKEEMEKVILMLLERWKKEGESEA